MMDDHPRLHRPDELRGPHAGGAGAPERPGVPEAAAGELGFADRLNLCGSLSPSMLRYPGPRDYCGFEAPAPGPVEERPMGGSWGPSTRGARGDRLTIDWGLDDRRPTGAGSAGEGPGGWLPEDRGDGIDDGLGSGREGFVAVFRLGVVELNVGVGVVL